MVERQLEAETDEDGPAATGRGPRVVTETETELRIERGGTEVVLAFSSRFVESLEGEPLAMESIQNLGGRPLVTRFEFDGDQVVEWSTQGARSTERRHPRPQGEWWTPAAAQRHLLSLLGQGAEHYRYRALDPLSGLTPIEIEGTRIESLDGGASRWRQSVSTMPGVAAMVVYDARGGMVSTVTTLLGMEMTFSRVDRKAARQRRGKAPELLVSSLIHPDRPIAKPRAATFARYRLSLAEGTLPELPSDGAQTSNPRADGSVEVRVQAGANTAGLSAPGEPEATPPEQDPDLYLRASPFLDYRSESVQALLRQAALPGQAEPATRAELLRREVHRAMARKDLETAFATASEAATERSGDCTEHAVLLTALLRADGIPARVVSGLLYVERFVGERDLFGYHLWSQAWLNGRWLDLDAMIAGPFDATHIALATSPLNDQDDFIKASASLLPLMGALAVEVLEITPSP